MIETGYQNKIKKGLIAMGGVAVNGIYSTNGEADLQCGYPFDNRLYYVGVEVKTEVDYYRVMACIDEHYNIINKPGLKDHEPLQMTKIRLTREKGGLALVAFNIDQVIDYVEGELE